MNFDFPRKRHRYARVPLCRSCLQGSAVCFVSRSSHYAYANSAPRHAIQNSLTTALVALAPLRLSLDLSVSLDVSDVGMLT